MRFIRFIFAPLFWLRGIRDNQNRIRRILFARSVMDIQLSPLSRQMKKTLVAYMLFDRKNGGRGIEDCMDDAASLLRTIRLDD